MSAPGKSAGSITSVALALLVWVAVASGGTASAPAATVKPCGPLASANGRAMLQPDGSYFGLVTVSFGCTRAPEGRLAVRTSAGDYTTAARRPVRVRSHEYRASFNDSRLLAEYLKPTTRKLTIQIRACAQGGCVSYRASCAKRRNECSRPTIEPASPPRR